MRDRHKDMKNYPIKPRRNRATGLLVDTVSYKIPAKANKRHKMMKGIKAASNRQKVLT